MRVLRRLPPTPEQINIVRRIQAGVSLIRGAAGSGKTSTALTALRATTGTAVNQLRNEGTLPANVLVLTYYNSLKGYITAVAEAELSDYAEDVRLYIMTFDKWAMNTLGWQGGLPIREASAHLHTLAVPFPRDNNFVMDEANYVMGRFLPDALDDYLTASRTGRGMSPQMAQPVRQQLLNDVVRPYINWKYQNQKPDFNDLAYVMAIAKPEIRFDVVVVDEAQDLSANQLRGVVRHAAADATITIVTDSAQRIYPRGAPWAEAGLTVAANRSFRLTRNYRNTREIASLAASFAQGLVMDEDGSLPDPTLCQRNGEIPILAKGLFSQQLAFVMNRLAAIDTEKETVGFLHLKGGRFFDAIRSALSQSGHDFCELQGAPDWPEGGSNIGLSTFHSAKGLEFDHVFMIGLAQAHASYGPEPDDDRYHSLRRLIAMGVGRARTTVVIGTKPGEALEVLELIDLSTVQEVLL